MPLAAGQSDKLGNRYEGVWTVDNLLDVLTGEALSLTVEPVGKDSHGIEFIKIRADGCQEFHSAKRQTTGNLWSLYDLTEGDPHDSVLGPLWEKLKHHPNARVVFVSGTTANEFNELAEEAARSKDLKHFLEVLDEAQWRKKKFDEYLLPLCGGSMELAFECLKRTEVVGITERHLIHRVEQRIQADLRSSDGTAMDLQTVRLLLADFVLDRFGQALGREELLTYLADHGCRERDLARDKNILALIADRNATYVRHVEAELIQNAQIERAEAKQACTALLGDDPKHLVVVVGAAGLGKSCVVAQTVRLLQLSAAPVVALRLDVQTKALTSDALGRELGLPVSPAVVLARIASGRRCVLVLDQMDALSFVSGRNQNLWDAFGELLQEAESVPNMRVLLACRAFDAEHDPRLRRIVADDKGTFRINLGLLEVDTVKEATTGATGSSPLNDRQIELLRIPLHLSLYLQGDPKPNSAFQTVQDLFGRYWTRKRTLADQQLGGAAKWNEVINALADWLSDHQTLSAPLDILDSWEKDARVMASQCVIVIDGMTCRFFHEAFFDYAFARTFAARGGKLCELLLASNQEQHLFRRAQVRQVLAYQRGRPGNDYASELRAVLSHPSVRFHLKKLGLDWLRSLEDPTEPEWQLLQEFDSDPKLGKFVRLVPSNSPAWFRVLDQTGTWAAWLDSGHESLVNHAIWLLSLPNVMKAESDKVAALIASRLDGSDQWRVRFTNLVSFADVHYSRKLFDLFLQAFRAGWFDAAHDNWWYRFHDMPKQNPAFACEFAAAFVERWLRAALEDGSFGLIDRRGGLPPQFMQQLEAAAPEGLARNLLPLVVATVRQTEIIHDDGEVDDRLCAFSFLHDEYDFKDALFGALQRSLAKLAVENPEILDEITRPYESLPHRTVAVLLLNSWTANGSRFADKVAAFILQNPHRLSLGYSSWSGRGGDGRYAITRAAFRAIGLHCSDENYRQLEAAVLAFWPAVQKQPHKGFNCYAQLLLLESLPKQRMSEPALGRLSHLLDKLPRVNFGPPLRTEVGSVSSPIPAKATRKMSDDAWILAMHKYSAVRPRTPENWLKGDMHTLSSELVREAQANKPRFAALALRMPGDLPRCYFDAILDGVAETYGKQTDDRKEDAVAAGPLDTHTIVAVIRRLHDLPGTPCGRSICSAFSHLADRQWPDDALDILSHYALNDPDPEKEVWQVPALGGALYYGGSPESAGLNSVRGGAAYAIARLLFSDIVLWPKLEKAVRAVVEDRSLAVRSMAVECLLALMHRDRDEAIRLFLRLVQGAGAILGGQSVDHFLHWAVFDHYSSVRPILCAMLAADTESARSTGARQIAVAAFHNKDAEQDLSKALAGDEHCREAVAGVFAHNLGAESVRGVCRQRLLPLFDDDSKKVRDAAEACFRDLSPEQLTEERDLIHAFIQSKAFNDGFAQLSYALEHSAALLPDVVCAIPERLIAHHLAESPNEPIEQRHMAFDLPEMVIRVYEQSQDPAVKSRCLNAIDSMLAIGFSQLESELAKVER